MATNPRPAGAAALQEGLLADGIVGELAELRDAVCVALLLVGNEPGLTIVAGAGTEGLSAQSRLALRALAASGVVVAEPGELSELPESCGTAVAAPLHSDEAALGVLLVGLASAEPSETARIVAATAAKLAGPSLAAARRLVSTFSEARRDDLTGLANHRAFHEHLDALLREAASQGGEMSLVVFDLDGFKLINDTEGHLVGDRVLRQIARLALRSVRAGEEVFRVGGEEFGIVLAGPPELGVEVAERVRRAVATHRRGGELPTLSAGVASFPSDARTKDELHHKADLALYAAKREGKNRVVSYGDEVQAAATLSRQIAQGDLRVRMDEPVVRETLFAQLDALIDAAAALAQESSTSAMLASACRHLTALLRGSACVVSKLDGDLLVELVRYAPPPLDLGPTYSYLVSDYPLTQLVIERHEPRAVSLQDEIRDAGEEFVLREIGCEAVLMLPLSVAGQPWGLLEVYDARPRRFSPSDARIAEFILGHVEKLVEQFENGESVQRLYWETLASITNALEAKDESTSHHTQDVGELALEIGLQLGLDEDDLRAVQLGAVLHDVGKIHVPESILRKPGPLTAEEWQVMRQHPEAGEKILQPITPLREVLPIVRFHHERWDGDGYPDGIRGEDIPLGARIVSVCDAYRAMVEPRPYRESLTQEQALAELRRHSGRQFDPRCVEALSAVLAGEPEERELKRPEHLRSVG